MVRFKDSGASEIEEKKIILPLVLALIPLVLLLICKIISSDSAILHFISDKTASFPAVFSSESILLSKSMDAYCKTAPFLAVIVYVVFLWKKSPFRNTERKKLMKGFFSCCIFLFCAFYFFMFSNFDLYHSSKFLKLMSFSDYSLTFFYISLYAIFYMLTLTFLLLLKGLLK